MRYAQPSPPSLSRDQDEDHSHTLSSPFLIRIRGNQPHRRIIQPLLILVVILLNQLLFVGQLFLPLLPKIIKDGFTHIPTRLTVLNKINILRFILHVNLLGTPKSAKITI